MHVISSANFFIQVVLLIPKVLDFLCWVLESLLESKVVTGTLLERRKVGKGPFLLVGKKGEALLASLLCHPATSLLTPFLFEKWSPWRSKMWMDNKVGLS